jgi:hypothetical protein
MPKTSEQYPIQFSHIGRTTIELKEWTITLATPAKANSTKIQWYAYARALKREGRLEEWLEAVRVQVRTEGSNVIFMDREGSEVALALAAALDALAVPDPAGKAFAEMMKAKEAKESGE